MTMNKAFEKIFLGYALLFLDLNLFFIDVVPDILGYYWISQGVLALCDSGLSGLSETRQRETTLLIKGLLVLSIFGQIGVFFSAGNSGGGGFWDVTLPETPPLVHFDLLAIASLLIFAAGIWLMKQILTISRNMAEAEGKAQVVRGLDRSIDLLLKVYLPVGMIIAFMEQCISLPNVWWGNVIHGLQELGSLLYFCFQLMLVLQIANLRKNLDCCQEIEAAGDPA